jgi:glycosyltransferase involved in cell wall biosynthesis
MATAPVGGAETFFITLSLALTRAGQDVRVALRPSDFREKQLRAAGVAYETVGFHTYFDFATGRRLKRLIRDFKPEAVLAFAQRASLAMPLGDYPLIGRMGGYYNLKYFRHCDHIICITPDILRHCVDGGWPKDRVSYIPNFPLVDDEMPVSRDALNTPMGAPVALALGRLHTNKAFDVLLNAVVQVPDLYLWIAGEGPLREDLTKQMHELGLANRVRFLGWRTDRTALLRAANICVFPSRWEPNGTVVVEAWSHGLPLVSTAAAGPAWIARNGEDAILTPVDDAAALAEGMKTVLDSPELRAQMIENGLRRVRDEFSEKTVVASYIETLQAVAAQKRRAA